MSDKRMTTILESQKTRRITDILVTLSLLGAVLFTTLAIFA